jgi:hypothetical protein
VYEGVRVNVKGVEIRVDLISLELHDFDVILSMDWLSMYRAQMVGM